MGNMCRFGEIGFTKFRNPVNGLLDLICEPDLELDSKFDEALNQILKSSKGLI